MAPHRHIQPGNRPPYGLAGTQVLTHLGLLDKLTAEKRIVKANSVGQAHSQTASGAADLGFVALAQIIQKDGSIPGSHWFPPADYYEPIVQQAVIVKSTREKGARRAVHELDERAACCGDHQGRRLFAARMIPGPAGSPARRAVPNPCEVSHARTQ
ncbi:substrate-binding domain-containing protein [Azotobacter vinelandii]